MQNELKLIDPKILAQIFRVENAVLCHMLGGGYNVDEERRKLINMIHDAVEAAKQK